LCRCGRRRRWRVRVVLVDELNIEDQVGLWRNHRRATFLAIGELVGDEEAALATDTHAFEALVPASDDTFESLGKLDGLPSIKG